MNRLNEDGTRFTPILKVVIDVEQNVVDARQRARQIAGAIGFDQQDQVRVATAVSELARNAYQYAGGGVVEFGLDLESKPQTLIVSVRDRGGGIADADHVLSGAYESPTGMGIGLSGAKKLSDLFDLQTGPQGTTVTLGKHLPARKPMPTSALADLANELHRQRPTTPFQEVQRQNTELLQTLESLKLRQDDLTLLNQELAETNRGVVALYAELDEKASSLQKANEVKTDFLSNMTHEFRTPLTSIISLTRLLTERIDGDLSTEQEKQVLYIRKSAETLLDLVSDLLDLAKVEAGRISLNVAEADVTDILGTLRGVFRPILGADSPVEFTAELRTFIPPLMSDEGKISQILRNLVSNALKFTETGFVCADAELSADDTVLFRVRDSGIGIAAADLERIFEDFSQVDSKLQKKTRGTGLGLPLSRKLARLLGGDLWVESVVGEGSTFYVRLPRIYVGGDEGQLLNQTAATENGTPLAASASTDLPTLMIIDDDETSRYVLRNYIRGHMPARIVECAEPRKALQRIDEIKPSLIFLDLSMPDLNGFEVLRELKSTERWADIPVCVNTAKILTTDETDFLEQLTVAILSKERSNTERAGAELRFALKAAGLLVEHSSERETRP